MKLVKTTGINSDFQQLVLQLDRELKIRDGEDHTFYAQFNASLHLEHVILLYLANTPVACGAFKEIAAGQAELKRMFTVESYRKKGYAAMLLFEVESWASSIGYNEMLLETGINQPEAVALYKKEGYTIIENYGQYYGVVNSICMQKMFVSQH